MDIPYYAPAVIGELVRIRFLCEGGASEEFFSSCIFLVYLVCIQ